MLASETAEELDVELADVNARLDAIVTYLRAIAAHVGCKVRFDGDV